MRGWLAPVAIALLLSPLTAPATCSHACAQESHTTAEGTTLVPTSKFRLDVRPNAGSINRQDNLITVECPAPQEEAWALQVQCSPISTPVSASDVFCISFDARALASGTEGLGNIHVSMATNDPWEPIEEPNGFRTFDVPNQWHPFRICFRAKQTYDANRVYASIQCAAKKQRLEIRDLKLITFGNIPESSLPVTRLFYPGANDDAWRAEALATYLQQIEQILDSGGALDGIGVQGHFQSDLITMPDAWRVLNELSRFQLPIEITEFDIDTRDEATQAQFTRDFLTLVFAHPSTTGFTTWGFWQGDMWRPHGAMIRENWAIKPNGHVWEELIFQDWWTDETAQTNADGIATLRVFRGAHRVRAEAQDWARIRTVNLLEDQTVTLQIGVGGE